MNNNQTSQTNTASKVIEEKSVKLEDKQNKKSQLIGAGVLLVIIFFIFILTNKKSEAPLVSTVTGCVEGDEFSQITGEPCFPEEAPPCKEGDEFNPITGEACDEVLNTALSPVSTAYPGSLGYDAALKEYAGKSFLFDASCVSTPKTVEVSLGSRVLVANNSDISLELNIQGRTENLRPYHYMTSSMKTAGEYNVSCNGVSSGMVVVK